MRLPLIPAGPNEPVVPLNEVQAPDAPIRPSGFSVPDLHEPAKGVPQILPFALAPLRFPLL